MVEVLFSLFAVPQEPFQIVVCAETLLILDMVQVSTYIYTLGNVSFI